MTTPPRPPRTSAEGTAVRAEQVVPFLLSVIASGERLTAADRAEIDAALAAASPLDEAWRAAEAALPEGWRLLVGREIDRPDSYWATASGPRDEFRSYPIVSTSADGMLRATPAAALAELVRLLALRNGGHDDTPD